MKQKKFEIVGVSLPKEMKRIVRIEAAKQDRSMSDLLTEMVSDKLQEMGILKDLEAENGQAV